MLRLISPRLILYLIARRSREEEEGERERDEDKEMLIAWRRYVRAHVLAFAHVRSGARSGENALVPVDLAGL